MSLTDISEASRNTPSEFAELRVQPFAQPGASAAQPRPHPVPLLALWLIAGQRPTPVRPSLSSKLRLPSSQLLCVANSTNFDDPRTSGRQGDNTLGKGVSYRDPRLCVTSIQSCDLAKNLPPTLGRGLGYTLMGLRCLDL